MKKVDYTVYEYMKKYIVVVFNNNNFRLNHNQSILTIPNEYSKLIYEILENEKTIILNLNHEDRSIRMLCRYMLEQIK